MFFLISKVSLGQSFEIVGHQDIIHTTIGETSKTPLRIKNLTDKPIYLIIRRTDVQIGSTQKTSFCIDQQCQENRSRDFILKVDPLTTSESVQISLEAGLAPVTSSLKYAIINKNNPAESIDIDFAYSVEESRAKEDLYSSNLIRLHNVYPNPVTDFANVDYRILNSAVKARIVLHNILGNKMDEYPLPAHETQIKIRSDALAAGIYFYTLYIENEGVVTRKLVVRK